MATVGLRGPVLAFVGRRWLPWAFVGLRWPSVVVVGCYGPFLSIKWKKKIKKKNTPRAQTTPDASVGPFFDFVGLRWPSLAVIGYSMAAVGLRGPALAFVGRHWLPWAFVGLRWPSVVVVGCYGPLLSIKWKKKIEKNTPRGQTTPDTLFGPFLSSWACVGLRWPSLAAVGLRGPTLAAVGLCRPALAFVGRCWLPKTHLGPKRRQTRRWGPFCLRGPFLSSWAC